MKLLVEGSLDDWRKAGKIAAEVLAYGKSLIKPGATLLEVSDKIEEKIEALEGKPAFPAQISCDHIAAHYCADPDDKAVFDKQVVCLDVGVHVNGCIGDNALTVDLSGKHADLVKASQEALQAAIKTVGIGVSLAEVGKAIQEVIASHNFAPIRNLSGHGLNQWNVHDAPTIPNINTRDTATLQEGQIIAIEPFATTGKGMIYEIERGNIFAVINPKPVRSPYAREILQNVQQYEGLPFTTRWLTRTMSPGKVSLGLRELMKAGIIKHHPPLVEENKGLVSQAEHTVLIGEKVEVLTREQ